MLARRWHLHKLTGLRDLQALAQSILEAVVLDVSVQELQTCSCMPGELWQGPVQQGVRGRLAREPAILFLSKTPFRTCSSATTP